MAKQYPYPTGDGKVKWVSTDWLQEHLGDKGLTILDCQPDVHDYIAEHIPGAFYMSQGLLRVSEGHVPASYIPAEAMQAICRQVGLKADAPVVVYTGTGVFKGWGDGLEQTMMAYSLARFGHNSVHVLDGGLDKWKAEGKALTQEFPTLRPSDFVARAREEYPIGYQEFRAIKDRADVILLDARPAAVYEGKGPWPKPGHIPGAISLPWATLMDSANKRLLKPDAEIQAILAAAGVAPDKTIICSCGTGREATNEFILFKWYLQYPKVRIYEGSFTEWTAYPDSPTVVGKNPR